MSKIGLSRTPRRRRYYLSGTVESNLKIMAIAPTMNMRLTEILMHNIFAGHQDARAPGLDGYTEWFHVNFFRIKQMQISLYLVAALVNLAYFISITLTIMLLAKIFFS